MPAAGWHFTESESFMQVGLFTLLVVLPAIAGLVLLIWALVDLLQRPQDQWVASGQDRLVWALVVIFVGLIGPLLYLLIARPKLEGQGVAHADTLV